MSRIVWRDGALVNPDGAGLALDDPGARLGVGLFETMRCRDGRIPWLDRHVARMCASAGALGMAGAADPATIATGARAVAEGLGPGIGRVRVTLTPRPTLLAEAESLALAEGSTWTACAARGTWHPGRRAAEHKTLSAIEWERAEHAARLTGADTALLLDDGGRLGEAARASVFCVVGGAVVTAPVDGILPGIARAVVCGLTAVREEVLAEDAWRAADEMFATNALRGVVPITACDGVPIGSGRRPVTDRIRALVEDAFA